MITDPSLYVSSIVNSYFNALFINSTNTLVNSVFIDPYNLNGIYFIETSLGNPPEIIKSIGYILNNTITRTAYSSSYNTLSLNQSSPYSNIPIGYAGSFSTGDPTFIAFGDSTVYSSSNNFTYLFVPNVLNKYLRCNFFTDALNIYVCGICFANNVFIVGERFSGYVYVTSPSVLAFTNSGAWDVGANVYLYPRATVSNLIGISCDIFQSLDLVYFLSINASNQTIIQTCNISSFDFSLDNYFRFFSPRPSPPTQTSLTFTLLINLTTAFSINLSAVAQKSPQSVHGYNIFKILNVNNTLYAFVVQNSSTLDFSSTLYVINITSSTINNTIPLKQPVYSFEVIVNSNNTYTIYFTLAVGKTSAFYIYPFSGNFYTYGYIYRTNETLNVYVPNINVNGTIFNSGATNGALAVYDNGASSITSYTSLYFNSSSRILFVNGVSYSSDERLKTSIVPLRNTLDKISSIQGVYYSMIGDESNRKIGFIAQNVEASLPELVHTDSSPEQYKSIEYSNMTAVLLESIKELYSTVQTHDILIDNIKETLSKQNSILDKIQNKGVVSRTD